jgi:chromosome segregation ATPase
MTTDERLDRLAERHGALAESLQLLTADVQGLTAKQGALTESLQLLTADVQSLAQSVKEHDRVLRGHADLIGDLVKIATAHEQRIDRVERNQG